MSTFTTKYIKFLEDNINQPLSWFDLSQNPNITPDFVLAHPELPWEWAYLSGHPNITPDFVLTHPELPWNWDYLSGNPNITLDFVLAHPDKPWNWDWRCLSIDLNITPDFVLAHPDLPWNWNSLSLNTMYVGRIPDDWVDKNRELIAVTYPYGLSKWKGSPIPESVCSLVADYLIGDSNKINVDRGYLVPSVL